MAVRDGEMMAVPRRPGPIAPSGAARFWPAAGAVGRVGLLRADKCKGSGPN